MAQNKTQRIAKAVRSLGLDKALVFTVKEMETIARLADVQMLDVMRYLRYGR